MTRRTLPRLLTAAATVAAIVAALTAVAGTGFAPRLGRAGELRPGEHGRADDQRHAAGRPDADRGHGTWTSDTTPTYAYQWNRCDTAGNNCAAITGATAQTYTVAAADVDKTLRVTVTATNPSGSTSASSAQTAAVTQPGPQGAIKLGERPDVGPGVEHRPAGAADHRRREVHAEPAHEPCARSRASSMCPTRAAIVVRDVLVKVDRPALLVGAEPHRGAHRPGRLGDGDDQPDDQHAARQARGARHVRPRTGRGSVPARRQLLPPARAGHDPLASGFSRAASRNARRRGSPFETFASRSQRLQSLGSSASAR